MKRYHINPETHEVGVCRAEIRCAFAENGVEPEHYYGLFEAHKVAEERLDAEYDTFSVQRPINAGIHDINNGCKYNNDNCPVIQGKVNDADRCEYCDMDDEGEWSKDPEEFQKDFIAGKSFGEQVNIGDQFSYDGEVYKVKGFSYNRSMLQYEIKTNKGEVTIPDDSWYLDSSRIKLLGENEKREPVRNVDDFTQNITPGYDGGNFKKQLEDSGQFYYQGKAYRIDGDIRYKEATLEYVIETDKGDVRIPDFDWYDEPNVRILPNNF